MGHLSGCSLLTGMQSFPRLMTTNVVSVEGVARRGASAVGRLWRTATDTGDSLAKLLAQRVFKCF